MTPTTLYLIRHGRTTLNAQGRFRGRHDPPLDEQGLLEAQAVGEHLTRIPLVAVFSSPLTRARQTAEAVAVAHGLDIAIAPDLVDLDYGAWEALTAAEAEERDPEAYERFVRQPLGAAPPGGERLAAVERRVSAALSAVASAHEGEASAVVSHEVPIRLLVSRLSGTPVWEIDLPTAAITVLGFDHDRMTLVEPPRGPW
jgi:broad specificity phosphatase PhoE